MSNAEKAIVKSLLQRIIVILQHIINGLEGGTVTPMDEIAPPPTEPVDS